MKLIIKYVTLFLSFLIINGCDKPAPTQLIEREDFLEIELITKDTEDELYGSGYDSTGFVYNPSRGFTNIITVSGIKTSYNNFTLSASHAQAIFFDKDSLVFSPDGRFIGYETRVLGTTDFNGKRANLVPLRIRFKNRITGSQVDTTLGFRHVLHHRFGNLNDDFNFQYNSSVSFDFTPFVGNPVHFSLPTESEINGNVRIDGQAGNLRCNINWNTGSSDKFEIIIGGELRMGGRVLPLYRLRTRDDGSLEIPGTLLNQMPLNKFNRLIFSIIRKKEFHIENNENELFILSQSIHNLVVDIP
jgi:hypothetical protein